MVEEGGLERVDIEGSRREGGVGDWPWGEVEGWERGGGRSGRRRKEGDERWGDLM